MIAALALFACSEFDLQAKPDDPEQDPPVEDTDTDVPVVPDDPVEPVVDGAQIQTTVTVQVADVAFLLDTTGSMGPLKNAMTNQFAQLADELKLEIPDITFGVATFQDYPVDPFGGSNDTPFDLRIQQTSVIAAVQQTLSSIPMRDGGDGPEAAYEALFQAASGQGYDLNCNTAFEPDEDIPPLIQRPDDAFFGSTAGIFDTTLPGSGTRGGMGFRDQTFPIIVLATDAFFRNPDVDPSPGGCTDAGRAATITALQSLGAHVVGVHVKHQISFGTAPITAEMQGIAADTNSFADFGQGIEPAVVIWRSQTGAAQFRALLVEAIQGLTGSQGFAWVGVEVVDDPAGVYIGSVPDQITNVANGDILDFDIEVSGSIVDPTVTPGAQPLVLAVVGDGSVTLSTHEFWVLPN